METNAFSNQYFKERLDFFNNRLKTFKNEDNKFLTVTGENHIKENNIVLEYVEGGFFRLDGYLYKSMIEWTNFPVLKDESTKTLWMSITPMELSSHYFPIKLAKGKVGVGGLGLGYYVESIKDKEEVEEIIIFETNQDVINLYLKNFGTCDKVKIIQQDVTNIKGYSFDFFYIDIYPDMLPNEIAEHYKNITHSNNISLYWFWGLERFILSTLNDYSQEIQDNFPHAWLLYSIDLYEMFRVSEYANLEYLNDNDDLMQEFLY